MIENFLSMLLTKSKISTLISFDGTPLTISSDRNDMVVVDVLGVTDLGGTAKCLVNIFLYAKTKDSLGAKPIKRLFEMERTLFSVIEASNDAHYKIITKELIGKTDKSAGNFYCNVYSVEISIH